MFSVSKLFKITLSIQDSALLIKLVYQNSEYVYEDLWKYLSSLKKKKNRRKIGSYFKLFFCCISSTASILFK